MLALAVFFAAEKSLAIKRGNNAIIRIIKIFKNITIIQRED